MNSSEITENAVQPLTPVYIQRGTCPTCSAKVECNASEKIESIREWTITRCANCGQRLAWKTKRRYA
ncbi:MAG: hypothetical protein J1F09_01910 [Oscillospiraceae bacterium]|nr:hypothetical protein [Oscillospiraceae bacterium]